MSGSGSESLSGSGSETGASTTSSGASVGGFFGGCNIDRICVALMCPSMPAGPGPPVDLYKKLATPLSILCWCCTA